MLSINFWNKKYLLIKIKIRENYKYKHVNKKTFVNKKIPKIKLSHI